MASHWIFLVLLASAACSVRCATIGEYVEVTTPTTYRWELSNKYAQIKLDWTTGEFISGSAESRDGSPECFLEHEVDCPQGKGATRWHCYKCSINPASRGVVPPSHSCHPRFFRNLDVGEATCTLLNHQTPGNSTIISTGLYPKTFGRMRRACTTPSTHRNPLPPQPRSKDICLPHAEKHRERVLQVTQAGLPVPADFGICLDFGGCGNAQCGKGNMSGDCCSQGSCKYHIFGHACSCVGNANGGCSCAM